MSSHLTLVLGERQFCEPDRRTVAVDFQIDGFPLLGMLCDSKSFSERDSLPSFVGLEKDLIAHRMDAFFGTSPSTGNLAPLLGCGECGSPLCGGVWTRVFTGEQYVNWAGFGFWDGFGTYSPNYLDRLFVFEREPYERLIRSLAQDEGPH